MPSSVPGLAYSGSSIKICQKNELLGLLPSSLSPSNPSSNIFQRNLLEVWLSFHSSVAVLLPAQSSLTTSGSRPHLNRSILFPTTAKNLRCLVCQAICHSTNNSYEVSAICQALCYTLRNNSDQRAQLWFLPSRSLWSSGEPRHQTDPCK